MGFELGFSGSYVGLEDGVDDLSRVALDGVRNSEGIDAEVGVWLCTTLVKFPCTSPHTQKQTDYCLPSEKAIVLKPHVQTCYVTEREELCSTIPSKILHKRNWRIGSCLQMM